jgi:hypothetical protein
MRRARFRPYAQAEAPARSLTGTLTVLPIEAGIESTDGTGKMMSVGSSRSLRQMPINHCE